MKHSLQLRLSQHLTLTPQLQQSIRLLQLSTLELNQELERFLQENPLLERDEGTAEQALAVPGLNGQSGPTENVPESSTAGSDDAPAQVDGEGFGSAQDAPYGAGARRTGFEWPEWPY